MITISGISAIMSIASFISLRLSNSALASLCGNYSNKLVRQHPPPPKSCPPWCFWTFWAASFRTFWEGDLNSRNVVLRKAAFFEVLYVSQTHQSIYRVKIACPNVSCINSPADKWFIPSTNQSIMRSPLKFGLGILENSSSSVITQPA